MKDQANLSTLHLLGHGEVCLHGDLDTLGEEQGDEAPGQIANKAAKNENRECIISDSFLFIYQDGMEFSVLQ